MCTAMWVGDVEVMAQTQGSLSPKFTLFSLYSISSAQKIEIHLSNSLAEVFGPSLSILGATYGFTQEAMWLDFQLQENHFEILCAWLWRGWCETGIQEI